MKIKFWNKFYQMIIEVQPKIREYFSDFLGLTKFFSLDQMEDWSKLLKFDRTCSNWQGAIKMNTKIEEATIFKAETEFC